MPARKPADGKKRRIQNLDELAQLSGFSKSTVSRAMANSPLLSDKTKKAVQDIAKAHGFRVNRNARKLIGRTNTIAVALDYPALEGRRLSDPFHSELLADVAKALSLRDQEVLLCSPKMDAERSYEELIAARGADGIIFLGQDSRESYLRQLAKTDLPFVVWGAVQDDSPYCTVGTDNVQGGRLVGQRFLELGRKTILAVGTDGSVEFDLRRLGLEQGLAESVKTKIIGVQADNLSYEMSFQALKNWFLENDFVPDGIFAASDTTAIAAYAVLRDRGLRIPEDVSVIGYDDIPFAHYLNPALTTVRQDTSQGGALLVEKLMHRQEGSRPASSTLPTRLIVRGS